MRYLVALFALITLASANFDLYRVTRKYLPGKSGNGWMVFNQDPQCSDVQEKQYWSFSSDVSGDKLGVRCKGSCFLKDVSDSSKTSP